MYKSFLSLVCFVVAILAGFHVVALFALIALALGYLNDFRLDRLEKSRER